MRKLATSDPYAYQVPVKYIQDIHVFSQLGHLTTKSRNSRPVLHFNAETFSQTSVGHLFEVVLREPTQPATTSTFARSLAKGLAKTAS